MTQGSEPQVGTIVWRDLTVTDASRVREFYSHVVGWRSVGQNMGEYEDYNMNLPGNDETVAGICHARGVNAKVPPQWLIYITVENLDTSMESCKKLGGKIIDGPRDMGNTRVCIIQDPAGAYAGLIGP